MGVPLHREKGKMANGNSLQGKHWENTGEKITGTDEEGSGAVWCNEFGSTLISAVASEISAAHV